MKIVNAKGLTRFASSSGRPDKEGLLLKRGDLNKGYQRRWFVLKANLLFYYEKRYDKDPIGVIILEGCRIEVADREDVDNYAFQIAFPGSAARTYILSADSQEEMEGWMKALSCAPYDYVKLIVSELENQLHEKESADCAMLVQAADRDSRLFGRAYSEDLSKRRPARPPPPGKGDRVTFPFSEADGSGRQEGGVADDLIGFDPMHSVENSLGNSVMPAPCSVRIMTWQMLGITNFFEMHDEIRRQIKEFSKVPCTREQANAGTRSTTQ